MRGGTPLGTEDWGKNVPLLRPPGDRTPLPVPLNHPAAPSKVLENLPGAKATPLNSGGYFFVPISTYPELQSALSQSGPGTMGAVPEIIAHAKNPEAVTDAEYELGAALSRLLPDIGPQVQVVAPRLPTTATSLTEDYQRTFSSTDPAVVGSMPAMLLIVALTGVIGMLLVSLGEQTRELGIRRALGAQEWQVVGPVVAEALLVAVLGCGAGLLVARLAAVVLRHSLAMWGGFQMSLLWAGATCATLLAAALLISMIPGYLATRVDPAEVLRRV
jgi:hypothetical protein